MVGEGEGGVGEGWELPKGPEAGGQLEKEANGPAGLVDHEAGVVLISSLRRQLPPSG